MGPFWAERLQRTWLVGIQLSPRGGVIEVRMDDDPGQVTLIGRAITVLRGALLADRGGR